MLEFARVHASLHVAGGINFTAPDVRSKLAVMFLDTRPDGGHCLCFACTIARIHVCVCRFIFVVRLAGVHAADLYSSITDSPILRPTQFGARSVGCFSRLVFAFPPQAPVFDAHTRLRSQVWPCPPPPPPTPLAAAATEGEGGPAEAAVVAALASVARSNAALEGRVSPADGVVPYFLTLRRLLLRNPKWLDALNSVAASGAAHDDFPIAAPSTDSKSAEAPAPAAAASPLAALDLSWAAQPEHVLPASVAALYAPMDAAPFHPLQVVLLSAHTADLHTTSNKQELLLHVNNEQQLEAALSRHWGPLLTVHRINPYHAPLPNLMALLRHTHVLIGTGGQSSHLLGALALFLREQSVVIELDAAAAPLNPTAQNWATSVGVSFLRWV